MSADFPDPFDDGKTPVVRSLVQLAEPEFDHTVLSLNRASPGLRDVFGLAGRPVETRPFAFGEALRYRAPPKGLLHRTMLHRLGDRIAERLESDPPDLLHAHKLSVEGIAVERAARRLGIPYALSIQGNTDTKILAARPDLRGEFTSIFHRAAVVFPFTPWALARIEGRLGRRAGPVVTLPCPTDLDQPLAPVWPGDGLISVFHLAHFRNKNLAMTVGAHAALRQEGCDQSLTIIGGGTAQDTARCEAIAERGTGVSLAGPLDREALRLRLNRATGFVLPSRRESFGLVFVEALFAGLPIIYPAGAAVDGHFEGLPFAIAVDVGDRKALRDAMRKLVREERELKRHIQVWQGSEHAKQFTRNAIAEQYCGGLRAALSSCG